MQWSALHRSTRLVAAFGAAVSLLLLGPIAAAVVMLRCCGAAPGPSAGARIVVGLVVFAVTVCVGAAAGGLASLVRRGVASRRAASGS